MPFFSQLTKVKPTGDPYPPSGSAKDKILHTEALGLVMSDVGNDLSGTLGEGLVKYGRARSKLAAVSPSNDHHRVELILALRLKRNSPVG